MQGTRRRKCRRSWTRCRPRVTNTSRTYAHTTNLPRTWFLVATPYFSSRAIYRSATSAFYSSSSLTGCGISTDTHRGKLISLEASNLFFSSGAEPAFGHSHGPFHLLFSRARTLLSIHSFYDMDYPKLVLLAINWYGKRTFTLNRFAFDCCSLTDVASDSVVAVFVFGFSFILITLILRRWTLAYRITDLLLYFSDLYPLHSSFFFLTVASSRTLMKRTL